MGIDPARQAVAVADGLSPGMRLAFCRRDTEAARRDLIRVCSEIRDEVAGLAEVPAQGGGGDAALLAPTIRGAIYISCNKCFEDEESVMHTDCINME